MTRRARVDAELVRRGLARSRQQAAELIGAGRVSIDGMPAVKPATAVAVTANLTVEGGDEKNPTTVYGFEVRLQPKEAAHFAFSTGLMFTTVVDRSYAVQDGKIKEKGDTDSVHTGVGILAHWVFTHFDHTNSDLALSAGIVGTDADVQFLVGGSWLLGEKQHFVISAGAAVGSVQRLDKVALDDPFSESTVPTKKVTRAGAFAGVSFKF